MENDKAASRTYTATVETPMGTKIISVTDAQINRRSLNSRCRQLRDMYLDGVMVCVSEIAREYDRAVR
jgi:hypothetical protein